ncbi:MAG TPA: neutral zinc metallopeptidase, partial [Mizugakiibacter sp.]
MKWQRARQSENVEDRRGMGLGGGVGRLGLGGVAIVVVLALLLGKNPLELLGLLAQQGDGGVTQTQSTPGAPPANDQTSQFVAAILGSTEDVWGELFRQSGGSYEPPKLVLFSGAVASACGRATAAVGPFYCPGDRQVYLDTSFFDEMSA